ncbi:MAG: 4-alpha-glucanotransferase [Gammaproteobacteria bacterium]|nr:4-alpha-glucanotransferase [Gammaproteobacteria bacterium]MDH3507362.1 4-alpha-glucanotransferase [Gammaproteobacteria bacterium]
MTVLRDREAGVCLHLTSLPGPHGIGTLGEPARRYIDAMRVMGLRVWQFLPIGPTGFGDSPYQSKSVYAGNPLLIALESLLQQGLVTAAEVSVLESLPRGSVSFERLIPLKSQVLARAGERFAQIASASRQSARDDFVATHDSAWLHDYALFEVLKDMHQQRAWLEWEPAYALRDPDALCALETAARAEIETVKSLQFIFFEQWNDLKAYAADHGVRLMGDVPIYVALDSADAWARRDLICLDDAGMPTEVAGVPPDYFSADGQLWGNPLYRWDRHAGDGFAWWISRLRHMLQLVDLIRLDHFRGFEAYWAIPADAQTAREGQWRPGPGAALFDALRCALGELPIVAEDLGVITPAVESLRERCGFPGMKVLQFMVGEDDFEPSSIPEDCVCYTGTHDNDTARGWFFGEAAEQRSPEAIADMRANVLRATGGQSLSVHVDLVRLAFATPARLVVAPLQDYLGLDSSGRLNVPGTATNNWRWRVMDDQISTDVCASVEKLVADSDRDGTAG